MIFDCDNETKFLSIIALICWLHNDIAVVQNSWNLKEITPGFCNNFSLQRKTFWSKLLKPRSHYANEPHLQEAALFLFVAQTIRNRWSGVANARISSCRRERWMNARDFIAITFSPRRRKLAMLMPQHMFQSIMTHIHLHIGAKRKNMRHKCERSSLCWVFSTIRLKKLVYGHCFVLILMPLFAIIIIRHTHAGVAFFLFQWKNGRHQPDDVYSAHLT